MAKHQKFSKYYKNDSRTATATKIEIFVSTASDSQPLTVVINDFVLELTGLLEQRDRL